jgi:F0F1-type ATP synthase assembly protein I
MNERGGRTGDLYRYSGLGFQFAAVVGAFSLGGHWLDGRLGSSPWLLLVGVFAGFALGLYSLLSKFPGGTRSKSRREPPPR